MFGEYEKLNFFFFCRSGDMIMRQYLEDIFQLWHRIYVVLILIEVSVFSCGFK